MVSITKGESSKEYYFIRTLTTEDFLYTTLRQKLNQPEGWFFDAKRVVGFFKEFTGYSGQGTVIARKLSPIT